MRRLIVSVLLAASLTACSWKDVIDLVSPSSKGGINTEIVAGDKNQEIHTEIGATAQTAETIVNTQNAPVWLMVLAALGWFMPTPQGMFKMWRTRNDT